MFGDVSSYFAQGDAALYAVCLGAVVPWVVARVNAAHWAALSKLAVLAAASVAASVGDLYFNGQLYGHRVGTTVLVVFAASLAFYRVTKGAPATLERPAPAPVKVAAHKAPPVPVDGEVQDGEVDPTDGE